VLRLENVSKTYFLDHSKIPALHDVSLEIHEGDFIAIMGPSGSGKSTLLHIMGGLDQPTNGDVFFGNKNLREMGDSELSRFRNEHVGFVFQDPLLLPHLTLLENLMLPIVFERNSRSGESGESGERIKKLLREVGLEQRMHHKPGELSGGQKQRACIARALIMNPAIVLADEPTGNLDTKTGREILGLFKKLHADLGITFIIATHDPEIAKSAKRIMEIQNGEIKVP